MTRKALRNMAREVSRVEISHGLGDLASLLAHDGCSTGEVYSDEIAVVHSASYPVDKVM